MRKCSVPLVIRKRQVKMTVSSILQPLEWPDEKSCYPITKDASLGVPSVAQRIKNLTATAWVAAEVQVRSMAQKLPYATGMAIKWKKKKKKKKDAPLARSSLPLLVGMKMAQPLEQLGGFLKLKYIGLSSRQWFFLQAEIGRNILGLGYGVGGLCTSS